MSDGPLSDGPWVDKLAIRDVLERYMRYNDDGALDRIVTLFDDDARYQVVGRVLRGHDEIRAFLAGNGFADGRPEWTDPGELLKQPRSMHVSSNPIIDVDGDTATAESEFLVLQRDEQGHARITLAGRYRDRLRKTERGDWLITTRTGVSLARPGDERTDVEWQRALGRMDERERQNLEM